MGQSYNLKMEEAARRIRLFVDENSSPVSQPPELLFHYTSVEGFIGIITSKTLWASDMLSLNDAAEASYATNLIFETLTAHHSEIPSEAVANLKTQLNYLFPSYTPFIACFCEQDDLLSQWRGYGNQGEGLAIGFSVPWLLSP